MSEIQASVGRGGVNRPEDVALVQRLLLARGFGAVGDADGVCGAKTLAAIVAYQRGFLREPDGRIDPGGRSWRHLSAGYTGVVTQAEGTSTASPTLRPPAEPTGSLTRPLPRPDPSSINIGLNPVNNAYMLAKFGEPLTNGGYTAQCQPPTNPRLRRNLVLDTVGPFRVTGLVPAVISLKQVMADIRVEQPKVYAALGTAGMLCCRLVRGSTTSISNHSWGTAIDLTVDGVLDVYGDGRVQFALTLIAPIFARHGWFWGAAFRTEDGMHFEASRDLVDRWARELA